MNLPNKLTVLRIFMIPLFLLIVSLPTNSWGNVGDIPLVHLVGAVVFALASVTDWLDGFLARKWKMVTNFGKFADPLADKMLVMAAFVVLVALDFSPAWVVAIIICRELAVTGLRLLLVEENGEVLAAAWPGKIKTATQMLAIIFLFLHFEIIGAILLYICLIATVYSGVDYFAKNADVFKGSM
ncbi:CDP-diacylglycerol--glycerol-3-phosphate 3-phosphatidyltransferase [Pilibacter termitis]|uniref:CDP-diacylglycerol--glycerol-3-phosphate 3-phosphatidyltransferase n=1 Tax=Pilibacter termitis TaxID=263852 RepID=A0A1T4M3R8_9ENTE|nr:CDP-diacylglycerol--glycerol-3-phosphate 3-phosphatidyltransferase [Pilibacter termitis]SJZ61639.1 CDP-diacylglycerol--glycerol-3-phosphate 3-phosphatidyltransferase [Pilibacter termitis]